MNQDRQTARIKRDRYIYRCKHLAMEATCEIDHGPRGVDIGPLAVDIYPVLAHLENDADVPTALFAVDDAIAAGCMRALQEEGYTSP